jgi:hypothetical protein
MNRWIAAALLSAATLAHAEPSAAKKELIAKVIALQQPGIDNLSREIVERPAAQTMQAVGNLLQTQIPPDKREAVGKSVQADVRKFVDESTPLLRERANKLAPAALTPILDEKFNDDELKQMIAWLNSPVNKKFQEVAPQIQSALVQKLVAEAGPLLDAKLQAMQQKVQATLKNAAAAPSGGASAASARPGPAKPASK